MIKTSAHHSLRISPLKSLKFSFLEFFSVCLNFNVINMDTYKRLGMMIVIELECKHFQ